MYKYYKLVSEVYREGQSIRNARTGENTRSILYRNLTIDTKGKLPIVTAKKVSVKNIVAELNWFLSGDTNANTLREQGVNIWNEWAAEDGSLGPLYGSQWVNWNGVNQIQNIIEGLQNDPYSRRHIVSAWNVSDLPRMALAPCHMVMQFNATPDGKLHLQVYQRSADLFLGVPYNITSYALLLHAIARIVERDTGLLSFQYGDVHLYENHVPQALKMLGYFNSNDHCRDLHNVDFSLQYENGILRIDDVIIPEYKSGPFIPAEVAV